MAKKKHSKASHTKTVPIGGRSQQLVLRVRAQLARILAILQSARADCESARKMGGAIGMAKHHQTKRRMRQ